MNGGDLLRAAADSPLLLAFVVVGGFLVYAVEKLGGLDGPLTRLGRLWSERELRKLRREAILRAERRRLAQEDESAELAWLRREQADQVRRDRARDQYDRALAAYLRRMLAVARQAGVDLGDPPLPPHLAPRYADGDDTTGPPMGPSTGPIDGRHRRDSARPPVPAR